MPHLSDKDTAIMQQAQQIRNLETLLRVVLKKVGKVTLSQPEADEVVTGSAIVRTYTKPDGGMDVWLEEENAPDA